MRFYFLLLAVLSLVSCTRDKHQNSGDSAAVVADQRGFDFTSRLKHADGFTINKFDNYKQVVVFDPWVKDTLASYIIVPKGGTIPDTLPKHDYLLKVPLRDIACLSSTHIGYLDQINEVMKVSGSVNVKGIYNKQLSKKTEQGKVLELGQGMSYNFEAVVSLAPEALMKTGFDNVRAEDKRLSEAGLTILYNNEWMESSMLARAEWIKFAAVFFNKEAYADSLFNQIEKKYLEVKALADTASDSPEILLGSDFKGTWYMPGGNSYRAQLYADAGADYYYKNDSSKGSLPLSLEVVLEHQVMADFWIGAKAKNLDELKALDERYALFEAFKKGNVYHFDKRINAYGGNDYWENGIVRPDYILMDAVKILHPELLPEHELFYFRKL